MAVLWNLHTSINMPSENRKQMIHGKRSLDSKINNYGSSTLILDSDHSCLVPLSKWVHATDDILLNFKIFGKLNIESILGKGYPK